MATELGVPEARTALYCPPPHLCHGVHPPPRTSVSSSVKWGKSLLLADRVRRGTRKLRHDAVGEGWGLDTEVSFEQ